jgi:hypothetical protein
MLETTCRKEESMLLDQTFFRLEAEWSGGMQCV